MLKILFQKIKPATTVKATALQQIQNIATNKINLIKANNEATDEEQNIAIAQVEKELIKAKQQIASAVTNADVAYLLHDEKTKFVKSNLLLTERRLLENN